MIVIHRLIIILFYDCRLCSDVEVSKQFVELEGVNRLIRLCKDERERNHSDGVLVACLVSINKLYNFKTFNCLSISSVTINA